MLCGGFIISMLTWVHYLTMVRYCAMCFSSSLNGSGKWSIFEAYLKMSIKMSMTFLPSIVYQSLRYVFCTTIFDLLKLSLLQNM